MKTSRERILTTHSGSLPRPQPLREMLASRAAGEAVDQAAFNAVVRESVDAVVRRQIQAGLDVVNDGESSKATYRGYVTHRLSGFGLVESVPVETTTSAAGGGVAEEADFPEYFARRAQLDEFVRRRGTPPRGRVCCTSPIQWRDFSAVEKDIANLKLSTHLADAEEVFMSASRRRTCVGSFQTFTTPMTTSTCRQYVKRCGASMRR
jgi:5-methyltetrahydropteroyltriglutamate--homocysteine methyltransferase